MATVRVTQQDGVTQQPGELLLRPGYNQLTGESTFQSKFTNTTSLEEDTLRVVSAIFLADLAHKRGKCEQFTRQISLTIPVVNLSNFQTIKESLVYALYVLSHDAWSVTFVPMDGEREPSRNWSSGGNGKVLLFSGGLDSYAAAVQLGATTSTSHIQLVSHITGNQIVASAQQELFNHLQQVHPGKFDRVAVRVSGRKYKSYSFPADKEREETQRTRSLVFLALAAITARRRGFHEVVMIAENGQMAIHLPLTAARISAFSTHTAHPEFVSVASDMFSRLLGFQIKIENPFLYDTKGQVVKFVCDGGQSGAIDKTISCWKASRQFSQKTHCGYCVPCVARRIALETNGLALDEYQRDMFTEDLSLVSDDDDGKRNVSDLFEFVCSFEKCTTQAEVERLYPDLLNEHVDAAQAVAMYRKFAQEARGVVEKYPRVKDLLR